MTLVDSLENTGGTGLWIGGAWRPAGDGAVLAVIDPATEAPITEVASATPADAIAAVAAASEAAPAWVGTSPRHRSDVLRRAFDLMHAEADGLAALITLENGKTLVDARFEVAYAAEFFRWFSEEAVRVHGRVYDAPGGDKRVMVLPKPVGVSLLVTPWNFPLSMGTRKIGPALAAGCTVVLKPAAETPLVALALADLLARAGVPPGVVNVIPTADPDPVVAAAMGDDRVRKLSFTGSTAVGRLLLERAAPRVLRTSMELGGNAPFLVLDDADLDAAVAGAVVAKMRNAGEACTAANRFYVHESVVGEFSARLTDVLGAMRVGNGADEGVDVGPLVNAATRDKVDGFVAGALEGPANLRTGGCRPDRPGFFYEPTVLTDVPPDADILRHEVFGPVAPIVAFENLDAAIAMANDTEYGLISYVYSGDRGRAIDVAEQLEAGMVAVNRGLVSDPAAPFGGVKQSGLGREGGVEGIHEYLEPTYLGIDR